MVNTTGSTVFVAVGRQTFDLASAQPLCWDSLRVLRSIDASVGGNSRVHLSNSTIAAVRDRWPPDIRTVVVALGTFVDSSLIATAVDDLPADVQVILWSFPEERTGRRLLRNSLCGALLAAYHLRNRGRNTAGIHVDPSEPDAVDHMTAALRADAPRPSPPTHSWTRTDQSTALRVARRLESAHIGIIGAAPKGFDPCEIGSDPNPVGTTFQLVPMDDLFASAATGGTPVARPRGTPKLEGVDQLDPVSTANSLRLHRGLDALVDRHDWDAVAVRCWPECFDWGGAACAPLSFLTDEGIPAACEADAFGALTSLMLTEISNHPAFLADLVDLDPEDNTVVFWHCGVAPTSMADPGRPAMASAHPNRNMPLAVEFGLRAGRVTIARLSQSRGQLRLVIGSGTVLDGPPPFSGTSGVVKWDTPVVPMYRDLIGEGLEHHFGLVYGDHRAVLLALASQWGIDVVVLGR